MKTDTQTLGKAMLILSEDIVSDDGIASAAILEAGHRLLELGAAHEQAMEVLRQIQAMPRKTREQKLANSCVRFLDALEQTQ